MHLVRVVHLVRGSAGGAPYSARVAFGPRVQVAQAMRIMSGAATTHTAPAGPLLRSRVTPRYNPTSQLSIDREIVGWHERPPCALGFCTRATGVNVANFDSQFTRG